MGTFNNYVDQIVPNFDHPSSEKIVVILHNIYPLFTKPRLDWFPNPPPHSCPRSYWMTPMDLAYFAFAVHLVHCLRMVFLNLDEKGERCRDCIETLLWLEALLLRFGGHRRKCPMTNIVSDKVRLSSTSRGTRQLMVYPALGKHLPVSAADYTDRFYILSWYANPILGN